jgi:hypothetical protein
MTTPSWILDVFAAIMLVTAAVSAARLVADRPRRRGIADAGVDAAHLLMGIAMAGMLVASLATLPNGVWVVIFAVMTAWFARCVYRESRGRGTRVLVDSHHSPHLVHSAAMVYMFAAVSTSMAGHGPGMSGMGGASGTAMQTLNAPVVALIFALLLAGYAVMDLDRLSGPAPHGQLIAAPASAVRASAVLAGAAVVGGPMSATVAPAGPARTGSSVSTRTAVTAGPGTPASDGRGAAGSARSILLNPRTAAACRIAMGVTMAFMLAIMI